MADGSNIDRGAALASRPRFARGRASSRRPRTSLLCGLASFVGLQMGLALAIAVWLPYLRDPDYAYKAIRLRHRLLDTPSPPASIVMLGSSRTAFGLKAKLLEDCLAQETGAPAVAFNFGITGAGPVIQLLSLRRLLAQGVRPDLLLVEVLPPLLAGQYPIPLEGRYLQAQRLWLSELPVIERYGFSLRHFRRDWWETWPVPWYSNRFNVLSCVVPAWLPWQERNDFFRSIDDSGWVNCPLNPATPEKYREAVDRAHAEYACHLPGLRLTGPACQALCDLLEICRQERVSVALVLMPEGSEFRSWYPPEVWQRINAYLNGLSHEYHAPVINAREWVPDDQFLDMHHLRPSGADFFTRRLESEVLTLWRRCAPIRTARARNGRGHD